MLKKFTLLIFAILLTACATEQGYIDVLNSWKGSTINELIKSELFGTPYGNYELDGYKYYTFREGIKGHYCKTDFKTKDGIIVGAVFEGTTCISQ